MIWKELRVAFLCGISLAAANFIKMLLVDRMLLGNTAVTMSVAATVCCTIVFVVMFAKAVGSLLPMIAEKIGVDPAVMASPLISTITDAVSLLIYFPSQKYSCTFDAPFKRPPGLPEGVLPSKSTCIMREKLL